MQYWPRENILEARPIRSWNVLSAKTESGIRQYIRAADIMITEVHICRPSLSAFRCVESDPAHAHQQICSLDRRTGAAARFGQCPNRASCPVLSVPVEKVMQTDIGRRLPAITLPDTLQLVQASLYFVPVVAVADCSAC